MSETLMKEPDDLEEASFDFSNFDYEMPSEADSVLRAGKHWMAHTAWDHWGAIWFAEGQFHERVMRYGAHVATVSSPDLMGVIRTANGMYGSD